MKKLYILFILTLTFSYSHAQWAGFNDNGTDNLWSNDANWAFPTGVTTLDANWDIDIYQGPTAGTLDEDYTAKRFRMPGNKAESFTLTGENTLTIDVADANQGNDDNGLKAIWNESDTPTTLIFNTNVTLANSVTPVQFKGNSVISTSTAGSIIEFDASKTLNVTGTGSTSIFGPGTVNMNGTITGDKGILVNSSLNFGGSTSDISGYNAAFTLYSGSSLTLNSNGSTSATVNKVQMNSSPATLTLESQNVLIVTSEIRVSRNAGQAFVLDLNVNANQTLSNIWLKGDGSVLNLNIDPSVTSVIFWANSNSANWHANAIVNITGFQEGVVKFGTDNTSLNNGALLANILIDGAAPSEPLALDATGNLYYESTLLSVKDHDAFEFSVYPIPANNELNIATQVQLQNVKVYNLLGKTVLNIEQPSNRINVSSLNSGIYLLALTSNEGAVVNKKIIID